MPLDPEYPAARLEAMLEDAGPEVVLVQEHLSGVLPTGDWRVVSVDGEWERIERERPAGRVGVEVSAENAAYVIFTSGSTGRPKGVVNEHRGIVNRLLWMQEEFGLGPGDRVLQKTPYSFDVSVWEFFWPLMTGATLVMAEPGGHRDPEYLAGVMEKEGITTVHFVPSMLRAFLCVEVERCRGLKRVVCSGEALPADVAEEAMGRLPWAEVYNLYGPTEAAVDVTWWKCERGSGGASVPIGRPIANTRIHILDGQGRETPPGVPGELYIGGVQVARGYLNREELTAERFVPDGFSSEEGARLYRTGDLGYWREDGAIEFLGRLDDQVKVRGFRIELGEIEARLREHPRVAGGVVVARPGLGGDPQLVAYIVAEAGGEVPGVSELREYLAETLPDYMVPGAVVALDAIPLSPNGKVDRRALPEPDLELRDGRAPFVAPRTEAEQMVAEAWKEVLGVERVGVDDNFFEIGGHSLALVAVAARLRERYRRLEIARFFEHPTLGSLAASLEAGADSGSEGEGGERSQEVEARAQRQLQARDRLRSLRWKGDE